MRTNNTAIASITGTTLMTLFSDVVSKVDGNNYNEAEILTQLLERVSPLDKRQSRSAGWAAHYGVGFAFATVYQMWLKSSNRKPTLLNSIVFGGLSGLAGTAIWHATFKAHPNPPGVKLKNYYIQLVIAHIIFGVCTGMVLKEGKKGTTTGKRPDPSSL